MKTPNYETVSVNDDRILIRDLGPWDQYPTITNNAEAVVAELTLAYGEDLGGRDLHYIDSEGDTDQLLVEKGVFAGFQIPAAGTRERVVMVMEVYIKVKLSDEELCAIGSRCGLKKQADRALARSILTSLLESDLALIVDDYRNEKENEQNND